MNNCLQCTFPTFVPQGLKKSTWVLEADMMRIVIHIVPMDHDRHFPRSFEVHFQGIFLVLSTITFNQNEQQLKIKIRYIILVDIYIHLYILIWTSILKVFPKQYLSPTGPNKYLRGITHTKIVAEFWRMHVLPAKHTYVWLPKKCDYQTDNHTDRHQTKWSLCATMLRRRHKNQFCGCRYTLKRCQLIQGQVGYLC